MDRETKPREVELSLRQAFLMSAWTGPAIVSGAFPPSGLRAAPPAAPGCLLITRPTRFLPTTCRAGVGAGPGGFRMP